MNGHLPLIAGCRIFNVMIIYNVTIKTEPAITADWVNWMHTEHIPEMMSTGLFSGYRFCRLLEQDETEGETFTVQYFCADIDQYGTYIREHAPAMREQGLRRFGSQFIAFRTVMETLSRDED